LAWIRRSRTHRLQLGYGWPGGTRIDCLAVDRQGEGEHTRGKNFLRKGGKVSTPPVRRVREEHRAQVVGRLRAYGQLSRAALASDLGLSAQTISEITAELEAEGVVVPVGEGRSSGGRRPILYGLRMQGLVAAGVHVEREQISAVISDLSGEVQAEVSIHCDLAAGQRTFVTGLKKALDRLLKGWDSDPLVGIGVGVPTMMRRSQGGLFRPVGISGWEGVDLPGLLGERYGLPVVAEARSHAVAVGEYLFGAGQGAVDLLCLVLDQGLGGAVISGGRLFGGGDGGAGALGRMPLDLAGSAGNSNRVADIVDAVAITRETRRRLQARGRRSLGGLPLARIGLAEVIDQALAGEPVAAEVLADVGRCLGAVVSAALCISDSQVVLLCGSTMRAGRLIVDPLVEVAAERSPFAIPEVRLGRLGVRGGSLGAAALVLNELVGAVAGGTPADAAVSR
jgi:predicted NBD/HSP70 family sugar kinase